MVLELIPNASPWYIKTANAETVKPKIAVAGVFCQHFTINESLEPAKLDFNTFAGKSSPLFFYPFEKNDQMLDAELSSNTQAFYEKINEINRQNIWDRPYYIRLSSKNIGSRNKLTAIKGRDDMITMEFLMPLFVVGDLEVTIPSELMAEWNPPDPWNKSFSLKNLLPEWGLSGFGKFFSGILIGGIVFLILIAVTPLAGIVGRFIR